MITIISITPASIGRDQSLDIIITGADFAVGITTSISGANVIVNYTTYISSIEAVANVSVFADALRDFRDVTVINVDSTTATLVGALGITGLPLIIQDQIEIEANFKDGLFCELDWSKIDYIDIYNRLKHCLIDEHIYDISDIAIPYITQKYTFSGHINYSKAIVSSAVIQVILNNELQFDLDSTLPGSFSFSLQLQRGENEIRLQTLLPITGLCKTILTCNCYNIHLLLSAYAKEFFNLLGIRQEIYNNNYLYENPSIDAIDKNVASLFQFSRLSTQTVDDYKFCLQKISEAYSYGSTVKMIKTLSEAVGGKCFVSFPNRSFTLTAASRLYKETNLTYSCKANSFVLNKKHYFLRDQVDNVIPNAVTYIYVDEEKNDDGYLKLKQALTFPKQIKIKLRVEPESGYDKVQVRKNLADFTDTDWLNVAEYYTFTTELPYENNCFLYFKYQNSVTKAISNVNYTWANLVILGKIISNATEIIDIQDCNRIGDVINSHSFKEFGYLVHFYKSCGSLAEEIEIIDLFAKLLHFFKLEHTKSYIICNNRLPIASNLVI